MSGNTQSERIKLVEEAIDTFGTNLRNYAISLCRNNSVDAEAVFDDLFIFALKKFPNSKLTAYGYYRSKLYQLFVDRWRSEKRRIDQPVEELPDATQSDKTEIGTDAEEEAFAKSFFEEYPVDLNEAQKQMLILWGRHGYTHKEIGEKLGVPRSTVADQIRVGRQAIVEYVNQQTYGKS